MIRTQTKWIIPDLNKKKRQYSSLVKQSHTSISTQGLSYRMERITLQK